jgi:hypothetical protein
MQDSLSIWLPGWAVYALIFGFYERCPEVAPSRHHMMLKYDAGGQMRTTLALDDDLAERTALVREALKALIEREASRRLAALGGSMPELEDIPRLRASEL